MCDWRHRRGLGTMAGNSQIMPSIGPEHWTLLAALQFTSKISLSLLFTYMLTETKPKTLSHLFGRCRSFVSDYLEH